MWILFTILSFFLGLYSASEGSTWTIQSHSHLAIYGTSNVNKFACVLSQYHSESKLTFNDTKQSNGFYKTDGRISIPLNCFDCGHRLMTQDFHKFLKHDLHPEMHIQFKYFSNFPQKTENKKECLTACMNINIAGCEKVVFIDFDSHYSGQYATLKGTSEIKFSDFGLTPPTKFAGAVKVRNELVVVINLELAREFF